MKNVLLIIAIALLVFLAYDYVVSRDNEVIVYSGEPLPVYPTEGGPLIVIPDMGPTWTPFYVAPEVTPVPVHVRSTAETGDVGNHDTGRTDSRTP